VGVVDEPDLATSSVCSFHSSGSHAKEVDVLGMDHIRLEPIQLWAKDTFIVGELGKSRPPVALPPNRIEGVGSSGG
jgi:hypothetical protein